mgnify:CR=1 FL=1
MSSINLPITISEDSDDDYFQNKTSSIIGKKRSFTLNDDDIDDDDIDDDNDVMIISVKNPKKKRRIIFESEDEDDIDDDDVMIISIKNPKKKRRIIFESGDEDDIDDESEGEDEYDSQVEYEYDSDIDDFIVEEEMTDEDQEKYDSMTGEMYNNSLEIELKKIEEELNLLFTECKSSSITPILEDIKKNNTTHNLKSLSYKEDKICCMCRRKKTCAHTFNNNQFVGTLCFEKLRLLLEIAEEYYSFKKLFEKITNLTEPNIKTWKKELHRFKNEMLHVIKNISVEGKKRACYM